MTGQDPEHDSVIDVHSHILLPGVMGTCGRAGPEMGVDAEGRGYFRAGDYVLRDVNFAGSPFSEVSLRLEGMDRLGIDRQVVSPNPITYFYTQPPEAARAFHRRHNDLMAEVAAGSTRLDGCATLPLQDPEESCRELVRCVEELGLVGSYLGADIGGVPLSDPRFEELWGEHERLCVPSVIHPAPRMVEQGPDRHFEPWDLDIVYGFLADEAMAVAHLLYGGVLDRHPGLRVHVPHGGGFAPYQKGRLQEGLRRRRWGDGLLVRPFEEQWTQLSFDSAVHRADALAFLIATEGPDRVMLGTNFAGWDHEEPILRIVDAVPLRAEARAAVLHDNAVRIFGLS